MENKEFMKMSFYDGTLDIEKATEVIKKTDKVLKYRYGFAYKGAELFEITKERALEIINGNNRLIDIDEYENEIIINKYSENDMF